MDDDRRFPWTSVAVGVLMLHGFVAVGWQLLETARLFWGAFVAMPPWPAWAVSAVVSVFVLIAREMLVYLLSRAGEPFVRHAKGTPETWDDDVAREIDAAFDAAAAAARNASTEDLFGHLSQARNAWMRLRSRKEG